MAGSIKIINSCPHLGTCPGGMHSAESKIQGPEFFPDILFVIEKKKTGKKATTKCPSICRCLATVYPHDGLLFSSLKELGRFSRADHITKSSKYIVIF